jgi:hypothetical protein
LFVSGVWQLKHLHLQLTESNAQLQDAFLRLQEEKVPGSNTLGTKTHLRLICLQISPQHYISFLRFLLSLKAGLFCSISDFKLFDTLLLDFSSFQVQWLCPISDFKLLGHYRVSSFVALWRQSNFLLCGVILFPCHAELEALKFM